MKRWLGVASVVALAATAAAESGDAERFRKATSVLTLLGGKYAAPAAAASFMTALRGYAPPPKKKP